MKMGKCGRKEEEVEDAKKDMKKLRCEKKGKDR